ncbi:MAG: hypothetical protein V1720_13275 [bacterium]
MKPMVFILLIISLNTLSAQDSDGFSPFSKFNFGVYGGVNFETLSESGGAFLLELKTNITTGINIKAGIGYSYPMQLISYNVKTNSNFVIDGISYYEARTYDVHKKGYDVFPVSLGCQYVFDYATLSPYISLDLNYNYISTKIYTTPGVSWSYDSFNELPDEYKIKHIENLVDHSYGILLGIGTIYNISGKFNLDVRYNYKIDSEIINTHNLLVGISI